MSNAKLRDIARFFERVPVIAASCRDVRMRGVMPQMLDIGSGVRTFRHAAGPAVPVRDVAWNADFIGDLAPYFRIVPVAIG